jgi:hypothetical protein
LVGFSIKRDRFAGVTLISATVAVVPNATEVSGWRPAGMASQGRGRQGLDKDGIRELFADPQPRIANLANETRLPRHQLDFLLLAKTHLAKPMGDVLGSGKPFDANHGALGDMAERTELRSGTFAF